jgi:hypothetical protein
MTVLSRRDLLLGGFVAALTVPMLSGCSSPMAPDDKIYKLIFDIAVNKSKPQHISNVLNENGEFRENVAQAKPGLLINRHLLAKNSAIQNLGLRNDIFIGPSMMISPLDAAIASQNENMTEMVKVLIANKAEPTAQTMTFIDQRLSSLDSTLKVSDGTSTARTAELVKERKALETIQQDFTQQFPDQITHNPPSAADQAPPIKPITRTSPKAGISR